MESFFDGLRKKPAHIRQRILVISTFSITGFIVVVWFFVLVNNVATSRVPDDKNLATPASLISGNTKNFFQELKNSF